METRTVKRMVRHYLKKSAAYLGQVSSNGTIPENLDHIASSIALAIRGRNKIYCYGSGSSLCLANYFVAGLIDHNRNGEPAIAATAFNDAVVIGALGKRMPFDEICQRYIELVGDPGDVILFFSSESDEEMIVKAEQAAHSCGLHTLCITVKPSETLCRKACACACLPAEENAGIIRTIQFLLIDSLIQLIEKNCLIFKTE
ncbi:MAG: SIS domain-containing protein [Tannerella sp.]|nr:SIS domain-containing protein [Tannerella sp.]